MKYIIAKELNLALRDLKNRGGQYQKAAESILSVIGSIKSDIPDPLASLKTTKNGESRIKKCIKYDLNGYCRLITIQDKGVTTLLYANDHDHCDKWLSANAGLELAIDKSSNEIKSVFKSIDLKDPNRRIADKTDLSLGNLVDKLKDWYIDVLFELISGARLRPFLTMDSLTSEDLILEACEKIEDINIQELYFDVFMSLKAGKIDEAKSRIKEYKDEFILIEKAEVHMVKNTISNDQFLILDDFRKEDLEFILRNANWHEWMMFMHPQQRKVVERDFSGPARLLGVSGSGKTSVVVNRAIRLAKLYPGEQILILTLNKSLSKLIADLIGYALDSDEQNIKNSIHVKSFWSLCQKLLLEFSPENSNLYNDITHKNLEDVEEIWDEFYQCQENNDDAMVMEPVHRSLLSRNLFPSSYIKQEFDWIRSALVNGDRNKYYSIERQGRKINFSPEFRKNILEGLNAWEEKMSFVGVIDYMGLIKPIYDQIEKIKPRYRSILVDELQDFGTSELKIIRRLVQEGENDLFLTGDIAQQVYTKHNKITQAGINIIPDNYLKILKNYRNSREILEAAHSVFTNNISDLNYNNEDFELLNPEYANMSTPKPFIRKSPSFNSELNNAVLYLKSILDDGSKACIAIAGYSFYDVIEIGNILNLPVLNGKHDLSDGIIFLSDMEQTKGFEFDIMVIVNVKNGIVPNNDVPEGEWFREISKIYVAMTRAKKELIISYTHTLSNIFESSLNLFTFSDWSDYIPKLSSMDVIQLPMPRQISKVENFLKMTGSEFLYTRKAIGLSSETQLKLREVVSGKRTTLEGKQVEWRSMEDLKNDVQAMRITPHLSRLFGPNVYQELLKLFNIKSL